MSDEAFRIESGTWRDEERAVLYDVIADDLKTEGSIALTADYIETEWEGFHEAIYHLLSEGFTISHANVISEESSEPEEALVVEGRASTGEIKVYRPINADP
jgi:hypothetical protein